MDSFSGDRLENRGGVAGEKQIQNGIQEAKKLRCYSRRRKIADLNNGSESVLNGNSTIKKKKPIDQVRFLFFDDLIWLCLLCTDWVIIQFTLQENEGDCGNKLIDVYKVNKPKNGVKDKDTKQRVSRELSYHINLYMLEDRFINLFNSLILYNARSAMNPIF